MEDESPPQERDSDARARLRGEETAGHPPNADAAFEGDGPGASVERAAGLLAAAALARRDAVPEGGLPDVALAEDAAVMGIPTVDGTVHAHSLRERTMALTQQLGVAWAEGDSSPRATEAALWRRLRATRDPEALLALLTVSLESESELQRVAAAAALGGLEGGATEVSERILDDGCRASDALTARVARASRGLSDGDAGSEAGEPRGLADADADAGANADTGADPTAAPPAFARSTKRPAFAPTPAGAFGGGEASIAIHGTWARLAEERWNEPGSPIYSHLTKEAAPGLYQGADYFRWSGGYDARSRADGTEDLLLWLVAHDVGLLDTVFTHSHGGSVALSAAARGQRIRVLVLMHTPALPREGEEWARIRSRIGRTLVMRTRLDLVVLADALRNGSRQRFDPEALPHREITLHWSRREGWFDHDLFLELDTWTRFDLAGEVRYERSLAEVPQPG